MAFKIKDLELPKEAGFNEAEKKAFEYIWNQFKTNMEGAMASVKSEEEVINSVKSELAKAGITGEKLEGIEKALKEQGVALSLIQKSAPKKSARTLSEAMDEVFKSADFKEVYKSFRGNSGLRSTGEFALKLQSTDVTNEDVLRTLASTRIYADADKRNAFLQLFSRTNLPDDKNRIMYNNASYTDNTGYVDELAKNSNTNTASLTGKYRELAKIGSVLPFSEEMVEDYGYFLSWAQTRAQQGIRSKLDTLLWNGDGDDSSNPKHIYGIKTKGSTAFNASGAGVETSVSNANLADLILAMKTQAKVGSNEAYMPNYVLMSYGAEFQLRTLKNTQGDYITMLPDGSMTVHGLTIIPTAKLGDKELLVVDSTTLQLFDKRFFTMEIQRVPDTDSYNLWLWYRGQALVTEPDKKANIYVDDYETALAAITKA